VIHGTPRIFFCKCEKIEKSMWGVVSLYTELLILLLFMFFLLIMLSRVQIEIKVIIKNGRNFSFVIFRLLRLLRIRMNLSVRKDEKGLVSLTFRKTDSDIQKKASVEQAFEFMKKLVNFAGKYKEHINYLKNKVRVNSLSVRSRIGTGDAASTALAIGGFFAFFSIISRHLNEYYYLQKRKLDVLPHFQGPLFDLDLDCIINFKIGHIIITGLKMLMKKVKAV